MTEVTTIGLDLAKNVFQAHGASSSGTVACRKKLRRDKMLSFFAAQPRCLVAMEACASAHHWARELERLGHQVRLIAPAYVKPFVKRQKNDAADAEAICEAAQRPTMRFVAVKSEAKQALSAVFRARDLLVGQRTQLINALRWHLGEYGIVAPHRPSHVERLIVEIEDPESLVPESARSCLQLLVDTLRALRDRIDLLDAEITARAKQDEGTRRLMEIPGIGPMIATAIQALAPPARRALRAVGARLLLLPKYSPDLNPIEQVFAKLKHLLRKAQARTRDAVCATIGQLLTSYTPQECTNYLANSESDSEFMRNDPFA